MNRAAVILLFTISLFGIASGFAGGIVRADIGDFTEWHLIEDPADPGFSASATMTQASLYAGGSPIPSGTDIGFATINGNTASSSTAGYVFDSNASFQIAIDYDLSFASAGGALGLGFGVGEDVLGKNSAGIALLTLNGGPLGNFAGAARVNDIDQGAKDSGLSATLTGSLFVDFNATNGDLIFGASQTQGALAPTATTTYGGLQNQWAGERLMASFFIRSQAIPIFAPNGWTGGDGTAVFSNFRVLQGSAQAVPEPGSTSALCLFGLAVLAAVRRRPIS